MGNRIKELREAAGLSQEALAVLAGTTGQQISRLELNERRLTTDWMAKISRALKVDVAALLERADAGEFVHDQRELLLLGTWRELPQEQRERVLDFVRFELARIAKQHDAA